MAPRTFPERNNPEDFFEIFLGKAFFPSPSYALLLGEGFYWHPILT
jgi:hypothetical protein